MTDPEPSRLMGLKSRARRRAHSQSERRKVVASYLPALMLVTDWDRLHGREHVELLRLTCNGGVTMVQMRDPLPIDMPGSAEPASIPGVASEHMEQGRAAIAFSRDAMALGIATLGARAATAGTLLFVHTGGQLSAAWAADSIDQLDKGPVGLHIPEVGVRMLASADYVIPDRHALGEDLIVSRSVHSVDAAVQAERDGADMLVLGTVFPSTSHPGGPTIGVEGVRAVCEAVRIPVVGIGGIAAQNAGDVIRAGASGVGVISAIFDAEDPRAAAAELRAAIDEAWAER